MITIKNSPQLVVTILLAMLITYLAYAGYTNVRATYVETTKVVSDQMVKRELLTRMYNAARERSVMLLRMLHYDDPFALDDLHQQFSRQARIFIKARKALFALDLSDVERDILEVQREASMRTSPQLEAVAELLIEGRQSEARDLLILKAIPGQKVVLESIKLTIDEYDKKSVNFIEKMNKEFASTSRLFLLMGILIAVISIAVLFIMITRLSRKDENLLKDAMHKAQVSAAEAQSKERFLSTLIENIGEGLVCIDSSGVITSFNSSAQLMFGYRAEEVIGRNVSMLMPKDEREQHERYTKNSTLTEARIINRYRDLEGQRKDGSRFPMELNVAPMSDDNAHGYVGLLRDITQRKISEERLVVAMKAAEAANQGKSEFLARMSHELRTPMNAILGFSQLLRMENMPATQHENINEIYKAGHHLLGLINEVLDLAKVESGHISLSMEPVEVVPLVEDCISLVRTLADKRSVLITHQVDSGAVVYSDRVRFKQALLNLLSNAVKYNREGGSVSIESRTSKEVGRLYLSVRDTGVGIPKDSIEDLFQPFNRLDAENSEIEGSGIGLTLTRRIVELIGGVLDVESEPGVGSTFTIGLPIEAIDGHEQTNTQDVEPPEDIKQPEDTSLQALNGARNVLYIEDNPANLRLMEQIVSQRKNIELHTAHTPELGLEFAFSCRPDLILLDVNLPGMDGYQVFDMLKQDKRSRDVPVIAITAHAMPEEAVHGMEVGFDEYLTKPLDVSRFYKILDQYL